MMTSLVIAVTGASGFVGAHVATALAAAGHTVRACVRAPTGSPAGCEVRLTGDLIDGAGWDGAFEGANVVVHCAGAAHSRDPAPEWLWRSNVDGSRRIAERAVAAGVQRLVFASSLKVHGETSGATPLDASSPLAPTDAYAISKRAAEDVLREISTNTRLELVVLRPPLMYGPGVSANFLDLLNAVSHRRPLPVALVRNRRSLLAVKNFADAVRACVSHPAAAGRAFLICDGPPVSTPELVRCCARALGVAPRLWPVPVPLLRAAGALLGRSGMIERLTGSFEVNDAPIRATVGWQPCITMEAALAETAQWFGARTRGQVLGEGAR